MSDLEIVLQGTRQRAGDTPVLKSVFTNKGTSPLALTFWWNRSMRVVDAQGNVVAPGPGSVLPCGVKEPWLVLEPGGRVERDEPLACTQPAGRVERIGWSYELAPGSYRVTLVFEAPPKHGFSQ